MILLYYIISWKKNNIVKLLFTRFRFCFITSTGVRISCESNIFAEFVDVYDQVRVKEAVGFFREAYIVRPNQNRYRKSFTDYDRKTER